MDRHCITPQLASHLILTDDRPLVDPQKGCRQPGGHGFQDLVIPWWDGALLRRNVGVDLRSVARRLLPEGAAAGRRTGLRVRARQLDRAERLVLFAAETGQLAEVARLDARRV